MNILYISESFVDFSLFKSQVHTLCNFHAEVNNVTLLALCDKDEMHKDVENRKYSLIKKRKPSSMLIPIINKIVSYFFTDKRLLLECDIIHCRGYIGSAYAINICKKYNIKKPIISDLRGALVEEIKHSNHKHANFYAKQALKNERFIFNNKPFFFFMSENMRRYYRDTYQFSIEDTAIFPTLVNEKYFYPSQIYRDKIREELEIKDKFVYAYVGGAAYWQNIDKILVSFNQEAKKDSKLFLMFITNDPDIANDIIKTHKLDYSNIKVLSLPYEEVGKYLNASDAGIIIRDDNILNNVASPTKINEYLAVGIKVVDKLNQIGHIDYFKDDLLYMPVKKIISDQQKVYQKFSSKYASSGLL